MDARPTTADSKHHYPPHLQLWNRSISSPAVPKLSTLNLHTSAVSVSVTDTTTTVRPEQQSTQSTQTQPQPSSPFPTHIDLLPILFPQQSSLYHAQLLQYNKLIAPARGRGGGLQTPPLPPLLSTPNVHTGPRSRSSSKVSNKDVPRAKPGTQNCHGNRGSQTNTTSKGDRAVITAKDKMPPSKKGTGPDPAHPFPSRPAPVSTSPASLSAAATQQAHSNSVPSTPHQHPRTFSFESREPSPNANQGHSPRSAYSETNGNVPSLRPLPPRMGGCKYETATASYRRRMAYNIGDAMLEKSDLTKISNKMTEDDERKLTTDMRELYDRLKPTSAVEEKRHKLVQKLEKILNDAWPGCDIRVHLFGSSGNKLCTDDSDVDICITTPWTELEKVCKLAELLANSGMQKVVCVSSAKVPIVKIWDPELQLACDMNVNNTLALENTRMIRTYVDIDERVRPLAMIIKYWTRRRIINDAAFGGTLSSYTWICMIIAFLQLRQPPVVPALHQKAHQKSTRKDGDIAPFADDLDKLSGFGSKNKATWGELLFQFFRYYAHEFNYSDDAISVRLGKVMSKRDRKNWILATNNRLCVEEPFNTIRNLGNTADDTSFRGIHQELRRAFDLISQGKLEECCEQYVFPKEEEKATIFQKPTPRPAVLMRSASQQHNNRGGRGGARGGRQQGQFRNNNSNHGNNRRASSSTPYDNNGNIAFYQGYPWVTPDGTMFVDMNQQLSALQLQHENNLRLLQYTQNQALVQQQALAHAQRMQGNLSQPGTSTERSRTNSIDNPPLTAPIRPEMWYWPQFQGQPYFATPQSFTSYPSSPSTNQANDQRRSSHRSTAPNEAGAAASGSSLRSQSQPASRPVPVAQSIPGYSGQNSMANGIATVPTRQLNGRAIPSFMPDEVNEPDQEPSPSHTPPGDDKAYGTHLEPSNSPARSASSIAAGVPAFGDIGLQASSQSNPSRRRLSSDLQQSILDRIKRTSRSPSPLGHNRTYSVGTGSAPSAASATLPQGNNRTTQDSKPLVVNGSVTKPGSSTSMRQSSVNEPASFPMPAYDNPLYINHLVNGNGVEGDAPISQMYLPAKSDNTISDRPLVVNGSNNGSSPTNQSVPRYGSDGGVLPANGTAGGLCFSPITTVPASRNFPPAFQRGFVPSSPHSPLIAQLDLATERMHSTDPQHLSPITEATPSPTANRKFDLPTTVPRNRPSNSVVTSGLSKGTKPELKPKQRLPADAEPAKTETAHAANSKSNGPARENGHTRGAKSESDNNISSGWQKIGKSRKKAVDGKSKDNYFPQSEQLPKNESERKGG
ncbi:hypothetical protein JX266_000269 [Neoarthrinium moseri]|nr:hypothetical protein JX266_000269 [Neoarthrinium moseri]